MAQHPVAHAAAWSILGMMWTRVCALVISLITARFVDQSEFGSYGYILNTVTMFSVAGSLGMSVTAAHFIARYEKRHHDRAKLIATSCAIVALVSGLISAAVMCAIMLNRQFSGQNFEIDNTLFAISSTVVVLASINGSLAGGLTGFKKFREIAGANLKTSLLHPPLAIILVSLYGLEGAILGIAVGPTILMLFLRASLKPHTASVRETIFRQGALGRYLQVVRYGATNAVSGLITNFAHWHVLTLLVAGKGGLAAMAIYTIALQWRSAIMFVPGTFSQVLLPFFSEFNPKSGIFSTLEKKSLIATVILAIAVSIPAAILSRPILSLYGQDYVDGVLVLIVVCLTAIPISFSNAIGQVILARGKVLLAFIGNCLWAFSLVMFSNEFLEVDPEAMSLAGATAISYIFLSIILFAFALFIGSKRANRMQRPTASTIDGPQ
ncbi:hypothetical protein CHH26_13090 [Qipengyuania flava]|nr:hypothetical protein CHH26_13090 [Qipengyuania flava]